MQVFENYFDTQDIETATFDLSGRSDHGPFADENVPVGGIFSGDSSEKTERQAEVYGGEPGEPYDACYHRAVRRPGQPQPEGTKRPLGCRGARDGHVRPGGVRQVTVALPIRGKVLCIVFFV